MHDVERLRRSALEGDLTAARALVVELQRTGGADAARDVLEGIAHPLSDWLEPGSPCEPGVFTALLDAVLAELALHHGRGRVHGALDPRSIFLRPRDTGRSFGPMAFDCIGLGAPADAVCVRYASPQRLHGDVAEPTDDVFAAGVLLYELYTGHPPWPLDGDDDDLHLRRTDQDAQHPAAWLPDGARHLGYEEVTLRALARAQSVRFDTADAMREALKAAARRPAMLIEQAALPDGPVMAPAYGLPPTPGGGGGVRGLLRRLFGGS